MEDKDKLLKEIKELWNTPNSSEFDIDKNLLEYLTLDDLEELKAKILSSFTTLSNEQKEWLEKFKKY